MVTTFTLSAHTPKEDRVRAHTKPEINEFIDHQIEQRIQFYATQDKQEISRRIDELDQEWDMERALEANAAGVILGGLVMGAVASRRWLLLSAFAASFLMVHAVQGWCPPVPIFRRLGVRTRMEIDRERYALKLLRGDFEPGRGEAGRDPEQIAKMMKD